MHNMSLPRQIQFPNDEISSPLGAQLKFSESELFPETLQNSEVGSISSDNNNFNNCSYEEHSSYNNNNNISNITMDDNMNNNYNNTPLLDHHHDTTTTITALCFEDDDQLGNNASTDFTSSSPSFSLPQHRQHLNNNNYYNNNNEEILFTMPLMYNYNSVGISLGDETYNIPEGQPVEVEDPLILTGYNTEESDFMSSLTNNNDNNNNNIRMMSSNIDPMMSIGNYLPFSFDVNGLFLGVHNQELEFQGDNNNIDGNFHPHSAMVRVFNYPATHLQAVSSERQHQHQLLDSSPMASEISDPNHDLKVGKLSVEERKRKIHRYLKKRNERNFSKKIKYACRKMLADSRPRVRGRFAKNEEIATCNNHEDDTDENGSLFSNPTSHLQHKVVKAEEDLESSDIFAHISGVNSFKCNYPIQSWI